MKRAFDIIAGLLGLILLSPLFLIISALIPLESNGGPFFYQIRVGKDSRKFYLIKFRTMRKSAPKALNLTIGKDPRITKVGAFLRKYKLDELPQLINVLKGDMSIVGPRPEVPEYVALYDERQRKVLGVRPGLTDEASLQYIDEDTLLGEAEDPKKVYVERIMPEKLELNLEYIEKRSFRRDLGLIFRTIGKIFS